MLIKEASAVVTGGASGLGEACARRLLESGARVCLFDGETIRPDTALRMAAK